MRHFRLTQKIAFLLLALASLVAAELLGLYKDETLRVAGAARLERAERGRDERLLALERDAAAAVSARSAAAARETIARMRQRLRNLSRSSNAESENVLRLKIETATSKLQSEFAAQRRGVASSGRVPADAAARYLKEIDQAIQAYIASQSYATQPAVSLRRFGDILALAMLLFCLAFSLSLGWMTRRIVSPLHKLTRVMLQASIEHDEIDGIAESRADEIGDLARAVRRYREQVVAVNWLEEQQESAKRESEQTHRAMVRQVSERFEADVMGVVERVANTAGQLFDSVKTMSDLAAEGDRETALVLDHSVETRHAVDAIAGEVETLAQFVAELRDALLSAAKLSSSSAQDGNLAGDKANDLVEAVRSIGQVARVISDVARQSNLLALNAAIEAARNGAAGSGFAIVALEVKRLAAQSSDAAEEIRRCIERVRSATECVVRAVTVAADSSSAIAEMSERLSVSIEQRDEVVRKVANMVRASEEHARSLQVSLRRIEAGSAKSERTSQAMLGAAGALSEQSRILGESSRAFLAEIRVNSV